MGVMLSTDGGLQNGINVGKPLNDCYGYLTQAIATPIVRVIPPCDDLRSCVGSFAYKPAGTAHDLTIMVTMNETLVTSDVAAGATSIPVGATLTAFDGTAIAANDYIIVQYEDGTWVPMVVSAGTLTLTVPATAQKILKGTKVFLMGVAADHPNRQFRTEASTMFTFTAGDFRIRAATGSKKASPLLFYSGNATAAGVLHYLSYYFD